MKLSAAVKLVIAFGASFSAALIGSVFTTRQALENVDINEDDFPAHHVVLLEIFDENHQKAQEMLLEGSSEIFDREQYSVPKALLHAQVSGLMGNQQLEHEHYDSARLMLEAKTQEQPEDAQLHSAFGTTYAGLVVRRTSFGRAGWRWSRFR